AVHVESEEEVKDSSTQSRGWVKKAALALALGLGVVGFMAMPKATRFCNGLDLGAFQGKSNLGLDAQMALKADALKGVKKPSAAEKIVLKEHNFFACAGFREFAGQRRWPIMSNRTLYAPSGFGLQTTGWRLWQIRC
ncbi:unnamed protein product, partial [Symbiodinium sp. CCMP2456]